MCHLRVQPRRRIFPRVNPAALSARHSTRALAMMTAPKPVTVVAVETRGVVVGNVRTPRRSALTTHVVVTDAAGVERVMCGRVTPGQCVPPELYTGREMQQPATCPICANRDPRTATPRTVADVNAVLKALDIPERLVRGGGYYYFAEGEASSWYSSSVTVFRVTELTIGEWLREYDELRADDMSRRGVR